MKKIIITAIAVVATSFAFSQQLPAKVKIELTDKQVLKIDSAIKFTGNAIDSKVLTNFLDLAMKPVFKQINEQLIKPKQETPVEKPTDKKGSGKP